MCEPTRLTRDQLRMPCDPAGFPFATTAHLEPLEQMLGQPRAEEALEFGASIRRDGYNLFVLGPSGTGKRTLVIEYLKRRAGREAVPQDWCYVNNFDQPDRPVAIALPAGRGRQFRDDMDHLVEDLQASILAVLESEEHRHRVEEARQEFREQHESALAELSKKAQSHGLEVVRTPTGVALAPVREGEVISPEDYEALPTDQKEAIEKAVQQLQPMLLEIVRQLPQLKRQARQTVKELNRDAIRLVVEHLIKPLLDRYADTPEVVAFLQAIEQDVVHHAEDFRQHPEDVPQLMLAAQGLPAGPSLDIYRANLVVDNAPLTGAPVIFDDHPTFYNLMGRIEHRAHLGSLVTDFSLIKAGSLLQANQGYLVVEARDLLTQPLAWDSLKRALKSRKLQIESIDAALSLVSTVSLQPAPIPLDVKVVVLGDRMLYYLLHEYDPDFGELFKVAADFHDDMPRTDENCQLYARLIAAQARCLECRALDREAVAVLIEQAARDAGDAEKISMHVRTAVDLVRESDYWAEKSGASVIQARHVHRAIDRQIHRVDRIREVLQEQIRRGTLLVETTGRRVGQVNGLSVMQIGDFAFGRPSRITATARLGKGHVVDIEREVELGGALHSKGVLILSSYLAATFAKDSPLSLVASLVFEQSYGAVDGDSASMAELCALLSVLADVPIRQELAITGSVDQLGRAQPIGGVNEKIEGFFDTCLARGLTGDQGVLIPAPNVKNLMLRPDVVEHCQEKRFHVYAFSGVDEAIAVLTGMTPGVPAADGNYPPDTVFGRVDARLRRLAELAREMRVPDAKETR